LRTGLADRDDMEHMVDIARRLNPTDLGHSCRANRDLRSIFQDRGTELFVSFLGYHDEIKTLLRRSTYR
jgi:hypothetical protein